MMSMKNNETILTEEFEQSSANMRHYDSLCDSLAKQSMTIFALMFTGLVVIINKGLGGAEKGKNIEGYLIDWELGGIIISLVGFFFFCDCIPINNKEPCFICSPCAKN